jgi:AcrR family transcriptional regulator
MTKHSFKERERQRREDDILNIAEQLFLERGFANLNMDDLASVVGISKPTLYQHFKSKDELAVKVLLRRYRAMDEFLARPLDGPAIERLIGLIRRPLRAPIGIGANVSDNMHLESMRRALHNDPELTEGKRCFIQHLHALVNQAKVEGNIEPSIPTPTVTYALLALNRSLSDPTLQAEIGNSSENLERAINSVINVFLHGVTPTQVSNRPESLQV